MMSLLVIFYTNQNKAYSNLETSFNQFQELVLTCHLSSRGGSDVEQWSDNITLSISVDQSPLGAYIDGSRAVIV